MASLPEGFAPCHAQFGILTLPPARVSGVQIRHLDSAPGCVNPIHFVPDAGGDLVCIPERRWIPGDELLRFVDEATHEVREAAGRVL